MCILGFAKKSKKISLRVITDVVRNKATPIQIPPQWKMGHRPSAFIVAEKRNSSWFEGESNAKIKNHPSQVLVHLYCNKRGVECAAFWIPRGRPKSLLDNLFFHQQRRVRLAIFATCTCTTECLANNNPNYQRAFDARGLVLAATSTSRRKSRTLTPSS